MFFFKKKDVVVDAFISETYAHAYDYAPIDYAENFIPDWWKKLPRSELDFDIMNRKNESMKSCAGFIDHVNKGLIIPLWSDLMLRTDPPNLYFFRFSDALSNCESHATSQRVGFQDDRINVKIISPWLLKSEKNVSFTFLPAFWHNDVKQDFDIAIGTTNFYYQNSTHMNLLVDVGKKISLKSGRPLLHLMPLTERKINLKRHLVTEQEFLRLNKRMVGMSFTSAYYKLKKHREKMESQQSKCPFSGLFK